MQSSERNVIGILTANVRLYYDIAKFLRARNIKFRLLDFEKSVPLDIGAILTSPGEISSIEFSPTIPVNDIETAIRRAWQDMNGLGENHILIIGVDPGPEPGIAAISSDRVIETKQAHSPEDAADIILGILSDYSYSQCVLKMGDGAPKQRDRILELVAGSFNYVEIVDESKTSNCIRGYHEDAAIRIARCDNKPS